MPLYRGDSVTLDTRLTDGETIKVVLLNASKNKVYLTYEKPPENDSPGQKPSGFSLAGGGSEPGETVRDVAYREVINETGFVTVPEHVLYVRSKRNYNPTKEPHRDIIVISKIVSNGHLEDEPVPQSRVVEKDEVEEKLNGWFELSNLPIQVVKEKDGEEIVVREGIYASHFLILNQLYEDAVIAVKPRCADLMHIITEQEAKKARGAPASTPPPDDDDLPIGWDKEAIAAKSAKANDDEAWRDFGESLAAAN